MPLLEAIGRGLTRFGDKASTRTFVKLAGNFLTLQ